MLGMPVNLSSTYLILISTVQATAVGLDMSAQVFFGNEQGCSKATLSASFKAASRPVAAVSPTYLVKMLRKAQRYGDLLMRQAGIVICIVSAAKPAIT